MKLTTIESAKAEIYVKNVMMPLVKADYIGKVNSTENEKDTGLNPEFPMP